MHIQVDQNLARTRLRHVELDDLCGNSARVVVDDGLLLGWDLSHGVGGCAYVWVCMYSEWYVY